MDADSLEPDILPTVFSPILFLSIFFWSPFPFFPLFFPLISRSLSFLFLFSFFFLPIYLISCFSYFPFFQLNSPSIFFIFHLVLSRLISIPLFPFPIIHFSYFHCEQRTSISNALSHPHVLNRFSFVLIMTDSQQFKDESLIHHQRSEQL